MPTTSCNGLTPHLYLDWSHSLGADNYDIYYIKSNGGAPAIINTNNSAYDFTADGPLDGDTQYSFVIQSKTGGTPIAYSDGQQWSHQKYGSYTTFPVCSGSSITLTLTGPTSSQQSGGLPLQVDQNQPVNLTWNVVGVTDNSCTASATSGDGSAVPAAITAAWNGSKGPPPNPGGPQSIPTTVPGTYVFSLTCLVGAVQTLSSIQLNVLTFPRPYIQTTGGDVHTNETITITP